MAGKTSLHTDGDVRHGSVLTRASKQTVGRRKEFRKIPCLSMHPVSFATGIQFNG